MGSPAPKTLVFGTAVALVMLAPLGASQAGKPPRGARVAVVAYHDSRLLTLCPVIGKDVIEGPMLTSRMKARVAVNYPPIGGQSIAIMQAEGLGIGPIARLFLPMPAGRPAPVGAGEAGSRPGPADLDRLARDLDVERRLIDRFRARKTYVVTDDPSEADFVFVAESTYVSLSGGVAEAAHSNPLPSSKTGSERRLDAPERIFSDTESEWRRRMDWSADTGSTAPPSPPPPAPVGSFILGGDRPLNWRQSILAIALPGALYRQHARDGSALSADRIWNGLVAAETTPNRTEPGRAPATTMKSASPEDLVDRFHARGQGLPDYLPVCAASAGATASIDDPVETTAPAAQAVPPDAPGDGAGAPKRAAGAGNDAAARFRSNVTLVTVPVTVTDRHGAVLSDLPVSSFHVFEDDVEQKVERLDRGAIATDVALLIDTSAGMREPRESIRSSAAAFAQALRGADRAMVVKFASRIQVHAELTGDRAALQAAIASAGPGGSTRLYDALALVAADRLASMEGRKAVVLFTDGRDTQSQLTNGEGALAAMEAVGAPVYVIRYETPDASSFIPPGAFGIRRWLIPFSEPGAEDDARAAADAFLARLASGTGGQLLAAKADAHVPEMIAHIAETLSAQLVLRYYPTNDRLDGTYRRIRVGVACEGCTVRARPGYRAGLPR